MSTSSDTSHPVVKLLEDNTRLWILVYLMVYQELSLKELSDKIGKGKTTIHHHLRKFEGHGIIHSHEVDEDVQRRLKKRCYHASLDVLRTNNPKDVIALFKIETMIISRLLDWTINYLEYGPESTDLEIKENILEFITFPKNRTIEDGPFEALIANVNLPILKILQWREKIDI